MNAMIDKHTQYFESISLNYIYKKTPRGSLLRKYFCDRLVLSINLDSSREVLLARSDMWPPEFFIEVILGFYEQRKAKNTNMYGDAYFASNRHRYLIQRKSLLLAVVGVARGDSRSL